MSVKDNVLNVKENIRKACEQAGRNPEEIELIAVTKYVSTERAQEVIDSGISHIGENRTDGFLEKYEQLGSQAEFHFIGTLQSRKVKEIVDQVDYIHSLDRSSIAKEIEKRANRTVPCFVQVNVSGEETKHGLKPEQVVDFIKDLEKYSKVEVIGLMTMAPHVEDENVIRESFKKLRELRDTVQALNLPNAPCTKLSMGMSNDYEIAIAEGATHLRLGTSLVGKEE